MGSPPPFRALIFDLGNVLVPFDHARACRAAARHSPLSPREILRCIFSDDLVQRFDRGEMSTRDFLVEVRRRIEYRGSLSELRRAWVDIFERDPVVEALVAKLRRRYRLIILSNTNRPHYEHLRRHYPVVGFFRRRVLSYEVGLLKPDPAIYHLAVEQVGCEAKECLYIDDQPALVRAAREIGIRSIHYRGAKELAENLSRLGLL